MKNLLIGLSLTMLATTAYAADAVVEEVVIVDQAYNWSGAYVGANIGYGWADFGQQFDATALLIGDVSENFDTDGDGILGGAQAGFNWQINQFVVGVEADIQATDISSSRDRSFPVGGGLVTVEGALGTDIDWYGTLRGRVGFLPVDRLLVYGTGGLAFGRTTSTASIDVTGLINDSDSASESETRTGWTAGAGAEYAFTDNWTVKLEYQYVDLGEDTFLNLGEPGLYEADLSSDVTLQAVKFGVNYKF